MKHKLLKYLFICSTVVTVLCGTNYVKADTSTIVTIGVNLSDAQKELMYEYFGVTTTSVPMLEVTNTDERTYLEGIATESQIGRKTYSCAYIEPTSEGSGIKVKIANLTWVTSNMIASTLSTAGIYDCNVIAAAPFAVSGTGALAGVYLALDELGYDLSEEKKELASEELIITGNLAEEIGTDEATGIIADVKNTVIADNIVNADTIENVIIDSSTKYEVNLTDEQIQTILDMMVKISEQDYDYSRMQSTLESVAETAANKLGIALEETSTGFFEKISKFFSNIFQWFKNLFSKSNTESESSTNVEDLGILAETNDSLLGENAIIDSTDEIDSSTSTETDSTDENSEEECQTSFDNFEESESYFDTTTETDTTNTDSSEENSLTTNEENESSDTTVSVDTSSDTSTEDDERSSENIYDTSLESSESNQ